ncbi:MAG: hypothetical protein EP339_04525 [Gammaproteobacteria bacterium]|nr:MAG: hypothetical protein EP339_04525 [Gammaproteobacteria bacterium]
MNKLLISSVAAIALGFAGVATADGYLGGGYPPGIQKRLDQGKGLPPGLKKKYLQAEYRRDHHHRHRDHDDRRWYDRDRREYRDGYRDGYRDRFRDKRRHDRYRHDRDRYRYDYRASLGINDHLPPELRVVRILNDAHTLIEQSRR